MTPGYQERFEVECECGHLCPAVLDAKDRRAAYFECPKCGKSVTITLDEPVPPPGEGGR